MIFKERYLKKQMTMTKFQFAGQLISGTTNKLADGYRGAFTTTLRN
jgi:hypothetical protein